MSANSNKAALNIKDVVYKKRDEGYNGSGQLWLGDNIPKSSPTKVGNLTTWKSVVRGEFHTAAIK